MKITKVIQHFLPSYHFGGTPIVCDQLARSLINAGNEVEIITTDLYSNKKRYSEKDNFPYKITRIRNLFNKFSYIFKVSTPIFSIKKIKDIINTSDVIHLYEYRSILNVIFCYFKKKSKTKFILQPHGTYKNFGTRQSYKKIFDLLFKKIINNNIDYFIVISKKEKRILLKDGISSKKIKLIPNGIKFDVSKNKKCKNYILYIGRINKVKGVDKLIKAYYKSNIFKNGIKLIIVGNDDGHKKECLSLVKKLNLKKFITFKEATFGIDKKKLLNEALLVSYVTKTEPFGFVPLESAMNRTWSLISSDSGLAEYVKNISFCDYVPYGDIRKLSQKLKTLTINKKNVQTSQIKKLENIFNWKNITKSWINLYKKK